MSNKKGCPLLVQSDTMRSWTVNGESHTRTYFLECLEEKCVAFKGGICERFCSETRFSENSEVAE